MRQTELFGRIRSCAAMVVMVVVAMLSAGCGSDDEVPAGEYYVGPDKDGWYTFYDKYSVYDGRVYIITDNCVVVDTEKPLLWRVWCLNLTGKNCKQCDDVKIKIRRFKRGDGAQTADHSEDIYADVELLEAKSIEDKYAIGPDKDGWYTFREEYSVNKGFVMSADEQSVSIFVYDSVLELECINISNKDCEIGNFVELKIQKIKRFEAQAWGRLSVYAYVELLNVKKQ